MHVCQSLVAQFVNHKWGGRTGGAAAHPIQFIFSMLKVRNGRPARTTITMRDVARLAQVSQSTVSRVLSAPSATAVPISEETVKRVYAAVEQLGYHPNLTARSLRGQKTNMIAMMIADIANPFYQFMVRKVQDVAQRHRYDVLIANSDHSQQNELHILDSIIRRPVDGVILCPYHLTRDDIDRLIQRSNAAVVALGQHVDHPQVDRVFADDEIVCYKAMRWLIEKRGHRRVAFINVPDTNPGQRRYMAYRRAMHDMGLPVPETYTEVGDFTVESGEHAMRRLLQLPQPPTAVFAANDLMAIGCLTVADEMGVAVPGDVAVMGFDNIPEAARLCPKLTTIAQYPSEMGERLANALFARINGTEAGPGRMLEVPCELIVRDSA